MTNRVNRDNVEARSHSTLGERAGIHPHHDEWAVHRPSSRSTFVNRTIRPPGAYSSSQGREYRAPGDLPPVFRSSSFSTVSRSTALVPALHPAPSPGSPTLGPLCHAEVRSVTKGGGAAEGPGHVDARRTGRVRSWRGDRSPWRLDRPEA